MKSEKPLISQRLSRLAHILRRIGNLIDLAPGETAVRWLVALKKLLTLRGAHTQEVLMTVLHPARKRGLDGI